MNTFFTLSSLQQYTTATMLHRSASSAILSMLVRKLLKLIHLRQQVIHNVERIIHFFPHYKCLFSVRQPARTLPEPNQLVIEVAAQ